MFKDVYKWLLGPKAAQYQTIGFLASSACAEVIADCFLAPFEAVSPLSLLVLLCCQLSKILNIIIMRVIG